MAYLLADISYWLILRLCRVSFYALIRRVFRYRAPVKSLPAPVAYSLADINQTCDYIENKLPDTTTVIHDQETVITVTLYRPGYFPVKTEFFPTSHGFQAAQACQFTKIMDLHHATY